MRYFLVFISSFLLFITLNNPVLADITGLAIIGDSFSDEYRADDNRGGSYSKTTFNWAELLQKYRGINLGTWGTRNDSRRTGFEYNYALSGDTVADTVSQGQHTKVAQLISQGKVTHVVIHVGANDFAIWNGTYASVYNGTTSYSLQKITDMLSQYKTIISTLKNAGNAKIIIANLADRSVLPTFIQAFPDSTKRQKVTTAIISLNDSLAELANTQGVILADQYNLGTTLLTKIDAQGNYLVGNEKISLTTDGDEPHHMLLSDHEHSGTVMSAVVVNLLYIPAFKQSGTNINLFTDAEILQLSGITSVPSPTVTPSTTPIIRSKFDVNLDGRVDLLDAISVISEIFK